MKTTEQRVFALENEVQSYRRLFLAIILLLSVGLTGALVQDKEKKQEVIECDVLKAGRIESQIIELASKKWGRTLISPGQADFTSSDQTKSTSLRPSLVVLGDTKVHRTLYVGDDGLKLLMRSHPVVYIESSDDGAGYIEVTDRLGKGTARLSVNNGDGEIQARNESGKTIALINGDQNGNGQIWVFNKDGKKGRALTPGK